MSARTPSVSAVIRSVRAPPVLRIDVVGPDLRPVLLLLSSAGCSSSILESSWKPHPRAVARLTPSHCDSSACASLLIARVRTPGLACCVAGWSPPGVIELEAERCSLDSLGAFTDKHYCGPAVTRSMHSDSQMWVGSDSEQSSSSYLFKSSQGFKRQELIKYCCLLLLTSVVA